MTVPMYELSLGTNSIPKLVTVTELDIADVKITCSDHAVRIANEIFNLSSLAEEHVVCLGTMGGVVTAVFEVSKGSHSASLLSTRSVLLRLLLAGCHEAIVLHNHPAGTLKPSNSDYEICKMLRKSLELLDLKLNDFIIVKSCSDEYLSFASDNLM